MPGGLGEALTCTRTFSISAILRRAAHQAARGLLLSLQCHAWQRLEPPISTRSFFRRGLHTAQYNTARQRHYERDQDLLLEWPLHQPFDGHQLLERKELGPHTGVGRVLWCGIGGKGHVERREKGLSPAAAPPLAPQLPPPTEAMPSPPFSRGPGLRCDEGDVSRMNGAPHAAATDKLTHWKTSRPPLQSNPGRPSCPCTCMHLCRSFLAALIAAMMSKCGP
jgi:hypothetical protein